MGYYMTQLNSVFKIPKENEEKALAAVKKLAEREDLMSGGSWSDGKKQKCWFSWVDMEEMEKAATLDEAVRAWRWDLLRNQEDKSIVGICFEGEKMGDDDVLLRALAPFVADKSYIEMRGEDDALWKWSFRDGELREVDGRIVFDDEGE